VEKPERGLMIIHRLLEAMVEHDASDMYLTPGAKVMLRIGHKLVAAGELVEEEDIAEEEESEAQLDGYGASVSDIANRPLEPADTEEIAFGIMDSRQRGEFSRTNEMNLAFFLEDLGRFRTNIFRQRGTIGLVIRHVKLDIPSIEELNLPPVLKKLIMAPRGLILVTGAAGSGKSTTLASMIDYRNSNADGHIICIEDPIEYVHRHRRSIVNQREVDLDTESFDIAMKNVLRQAPDVILVGEIRDRQTMENVMQYAETGHLVLSTLHSTNANQTIQRIIQFFPKDIESKIYQQVSQTLRAVVSQRLLPRADGEGVIPAVEVMITSARVRELIAKGESESLKPVMESARQDGMQTFDQSLFDLVSMGLVTEDAAMQAADSPGDLRLRLQGLGSGTVAIR